MKRNDSESTMKQEERETRPAGSAEAAAPPAEPGPAAKSGPAGSTEAEMGEATDALQIDIAALNDRLLRLQADFDNFRKRTARERVGMRERALEDLMRDLLPVLDHFELGLSAAEQQGVEASVRDGFSMVLDQLRSVLDRYGLAPVEAEDKPFDPHLHEAVTAAPSADAPRDTVLRETRRGYTLAGRLLRAAQVVVSEGAKDDGAEADHA